MSEEDLELLVTIDDPGEDTLGEDTFHQHPTEKNRSPDPGIPPSIIVP